MSKSKIVLSFDDGRKDNMRVVQEILNPLGMKATINITTGYVDGSIDSTHAPCPNEALTRDEVTQIAEYSNIELAGHGKEHQNSIEDLGEGIQMLRQWLPDRKINGIASPNSKLVEDVILAQQGAYEDLGVDYVRIGPGRSYHKLRRICGKLARITGSPALFCYSIAGAHLADKTGYVLLSVPVMNQHSLRQVKTLVRDVVKREESLILMFHSILKPGEAYYDDTWSWDYEDFKLLCRWLAVNDQLEVVTTQELTQTE